MNKGVITAWSPQEDTALHRMWVHEGMSASMCAAALGRSRNSIIGRVHRKGWSRETASKPTLFKAYPKRAAPKQVRRKQTPAPSFVAPSFNQAGPVEPTPPDLRKTAVASPNAKPWLERAFGECAFPVDGHGADTRSCCNPTDATYCAAHKAIMTSPAGKLNTYGIEMDRPKRRPAQAKERFFTDWAA